MDKPSHAQIPAYRRARGYRLYGDSGKRFLDFYQDGGRAILGHGQPRIVLEMKKTLSRGQIAPYPSRYALQTAGAVRKLIPGVLEVRIYRSEERALYAAGRHLRTTLTQADICDPGLPESGAGKLSLWRPFLEGEAFDAPLLLPVLPLSVPPGPAVLAFREKPGEEVPQSDDCSPLSLAALKKSIFELLRYIEGCERSRWAYFDSFSIWSRKGPYLTLNMEEAGFAPLFNEMLENGILLAPRYPGPSIIPGEFTPGEVSYLKKRFAAG